MTDTDPRAILERYWGFTAFKGSQARIIDALLQGKDVMALLPTGGGKSICFQVPALARDGICIVVSPLIALIQDQTDRLKERGIKAIALTGGISSEETDQLLDNARFGNYKFLYLSPERLQQELVRQRIAQMHVNLIAIDEAHCISQWGHDFRPAYLECSRLRELLPGTPLIALTATATAPVVEDIMANLRMPEALVARDSFARNNLVFGVQWAADKRYRLKQLCAEVDTSAIVYVRTRRSAEALAHYLGGAGQEAVFYHGGIERAEKEKRSRKWLKGHVKTIVATNAFGMGIDKPDVGLVVHYQIPDSLENYVQEAGRAGRDGTPAKAVLLIDRADVQQVKDQFLGALPDTAFLKKLYNKLNNYFQIAYGEGADTTFPLDFNAFCTTYGLAVPLAYNGLRILDRYSVVALSEAFSRKTTLQITVDKEVLFGYLEQNRNKAPVVRALLRTYGGLFDYETRINPDLIAKKIQRPKREVTDILEELRANKIMEYRAEDSDLSLTFLVPREDDRTIHRFAAEVKERQRTVVANVHHMLRYVHSDRPCRKLQLLAHFGEKGSKVCGRCDICTRTRGPMAPALINSAQEQIVQRLARGQCGSRTLVAGSDHGEQVVLRALQLLLEERRIAVNTRNEYELL